MMQEYNTNTHTHTHVHMDILLLTSSFASVEAPASSSGHAGVVKLLLEAGAAIEAKDIVSKRISICTCVCVCVLYSSIIVLFYSLLLFDYCDI